MEQNNSTIEKNIFVIKPYTLTELALLYYPEKQKQNARKLFKKDLERHPTLLKELKELGYKVFAYTPLQKGRKKNSNSYFTPKMVQCIINALDYPSNTIKY